jgi:hypothetical protein
MELFEHCAEMTEPTEGYVQPGWVISPECPDGYDYVEPWCKRHGYSGAAPQTAEGQKQPPDPCDVVVSFSRGVAFSAWGKLDFGSAKSDMAMVGAATALIIAVMALISLRLKPRRAAK